MSVCVCVPVRARAHFVRRNHSWLFDFCAGTTPAVLLRHLFPAQGEARPPADRIVFARGDLSRREVRAGAHASARACLRMGVYVGEYVRARAREFSTNLCIVGALFTGWCGFDEGRAEKYQHRERRGARQIIRRAAPDRQGPSEAQSAVRSREVSHRFTASGGL